MKIEINGLFVGIDDLTLTVTSVTPEIVHNFIEKLIHRLCDRNENTVEWVTRIEQRQTDGKYDREIQFVSTERAN